MPSSKLCIIQANCQADALEALLRAMPSFTKHYKLKRYVNFLNEPVPEEALASCDIFIYQHLGDKWEELASAVILAKLNKNALKIKIPNLLFKGYWPFWTSHSPSEFGDLYLDKLIGMGLNKSEILHIYLNTAFENKFDPKAIFEDSMKIERKKEKGCVIELSGFISENFKNLELFYTINHPSLLLLCKIAQAVLAKMEIPAPSNLENMLQNPYSELNLPIHPQLTKFWPLSFVQNSFNVFGKNKTFEEYTSNYIDSQLLNIKPLSAYLQLV